MQEINVDFHIHSKYSRGTSADMTIPRIAEGAIGKGLHVIGTGDATHLGWLDHIEKNLIDDSNGLYSLENSGVSDGKSSVKFMITSEVEDKNRVHHLLLFPSIDCARRFREDVKRSSVDIDSDGRPHVGLSGEELVDLANDCDSMVGPCHAFTPWTSIYKEFDSLKGCYGDNVRYVKFLELGLSADSDMADRIEELKDITFMSNSDAHSPWPHKLGREFNRLLVDSLDFDEIRKAIERKGGRKFALNVGLDPREGKYHETACTRCFTKFKPRDAVQLKRRCPLCGGIIKVGVRERVEELAAGRETLHPKHRPPYMKIIPLAEVIGIARGVSTLTGPKIQREWHAMVEKFGPEIKILIDKDVRCLRKYDEKIGDIIDLFRQGRIAYDSGGGGKYGRPIYGRAFKEKFYDCSQKCLGEF